ncbi:UNVERIFIED_CONTAM: hypothetical protein GTU68_040732 [Idotea baltica]|nr:hypothetical protein [Idotea baltica]
MENIRDWCISRQLWWGQQIPAYYLDDETIIVAKTKEEALAKAKKQTGNDELTIDDLRQDPDVVDTWFSSWLWPIAVFDGFEDRTELDYYYPTKVLVTGWDIIFFWVARMIIAGMEYEQQKPFDAVYFTGMVRDPKRRKMSKSLGNSPDALQMIKDYGADGVRVGMLLSAPVGGDLLFDIKLVEQGRNFCNKIWNAFRLIKNWEVKAGTNENNAVAVKWFSQKIDAVNLQLEDYYKGFRLSEGLKTLYSFVWDDFCSNYLEMIKPTYGEAIDQQTYDDTLALFEKVMLLCHPFIPFLTEEIYHALKDRPDGESICTQSYPAIQSFDQDTIDRGEYAKEIISKIRDIRNKSQISPKEPLQLFAQLEAEKAIGDFKGIVQKLAFIESINFGGSASENAVNFLVKTGEFFLETGVEIDAEAEKEKIQKELKYNEGFKNSVLKKLDNERFVSNAPEAVIAKEKQKLADAEEKIRLLTENLKKLS